MLKGTHKAISSIFSSLVVIGITLSLIPPLLIYFNQTNSIELNVSDSLFEKEQNLITTKVSLVGLGGDTNGLFIYNYGNAPINVSRVFINAEDFRVSVSVPAGDLVKLSSLVGEVTNVSTVGLCVNGNLYVFELK